MTTETQAAQLQLGTPETPLDEALPETWGGKGVGLIRLSQAGLEVPEFFVLPAALRDCVRASGNPSADHPLLLALVREGLQRLPEGPVAVRSSGVDEDGDHRSLAGQFDTFLAVPPDARAVAAKVLACWASLQSERARAYRSRHGLDAEGGAIAVVVQAMVPAERSVVIFSGNPTTGDADETVVASVWGLGDTLVAGDLEGDTDVLGPSGRALQHLSGGQTQARRLHADGSIAVEELPAELVGKPVLSPANRQAAWQLGRAIASWAGRPMDIEAAFLGGRLLVLQARPVTTPLSRHRRLWDNANVVESYGGVTTPLTFSHASLAYRIVYTQFGRLLGVPRHIHDTHEREMQTYVGLLDGRVYYNLLMWYLSMAHLPGYAFTRSAMENMMGVREALDVELPPAGSPLQAWTRDLPRLARMLARTAWAFATIDRRIGAFERNFEAVHGAWRDQRFEGWETARLVDLYHTLLVQVLHRWEAPILTDVGAMVSMALLQGLLAKWAPGCPNLAGELLVGAGDIESTAPTRELTALAARVRAHPTAMALLAGPPEAAWEALHRDVTCKGLAAELDAWVSRYGDRAMGELKLETQTPREQPSLVVPLLRSYVAMAGTQLPPAPDNTKAEARLDEALAGSPFRRLAARTVLHWTRKHVRNRENMRFARTRLTGVLRRLFRAVGEDLVRVGLLSQAEDVFYLTVEELTAYVDGRSVTRDLGALALLRRKEYDGYGQAEPPERFVTIGLPHLRVPEAPPAPGGDATAFVGTPCCPGVVTGPTRLVRDPADAGDLAGEILVAPRTDPGWVALYPAISGLLVERGSVLSHSAIVAREMGLPTIVGVQGLCARLGAGQRVRMDGGTGRIELLPHEEASP
ncbi:MAG: PEP/pyruvate-binding domain-containing protein [Candidatus Sericytochromatia bacterium]|nr:PEP/pyruvate-binding domain-containing protein [Candidatus Sericytochromatia bacterium]